MSIYTQQELELLFIGSIFADGNNVIYGMDVISQGDLTTTPAIKIWEASQSLFKNKTEITIQSIVIEVGTKDFLGFISQAVDCGSKYNCQMIAGELAENGRVRRLTSKINSLSNIGHKDSETLLEELKDAYSSELKTGGEKGDIESCFFDFDERVKLNINNGTLGISTGFDVFSNLDIDYEPGHCWAYGGYTNVGKTAFMIEQIVRILEPGGDIPKMAIHSTEMKRHQLLARLLAGMTGVGHKLILRGKSTQSIEQAKGVLLRSGLKIYDVNRDFDVFCNQCRKDKLQDGLDLVWADYLQNFKRKGLRGYELMSDLGKDSLALPQELDMTLFMLSQISTSEFKEDSGGLAFKGAGELGESCDIGLWLSRCKTKENSILVEHRKNRHGQKEDFVMEFQPNSNRLFEVRR